MFQTGLFTRVTGYTAKEAITKVAPDGKVIGEFSLGVGGGSDKYPVIWVRVTVWEKLAQEAESVIDQKGIAVEASGILSISEYDFERGRRVLVLSCNNARYMLSSWHGKSM